MTFRFPKASIIIFCKAPVPGTVKTRLMPHISETEANDLHVELATRVILMAQNSGLAPVELCGTPDTSHPFFTDIAQTDVTTLHQQQGQDLGERMAGALASSLARPGNESAILIGTDCVNLDENYVHAALESLQHSPACLGPAEDGGYGLIGLKQANQVLFEDVSWGTNSVCASTARHMNQQFDNWQLLSLLWDVDRPEDLVRYLRGKSCALSPVLRHQTLRALARV